MVIKNKTRAIMKILNPSVHIFAPITGVVVFLVFFMTIMVTLIQYENKENNTFESSISIIKKSQGTERLNNSNNKNSNSTLKSNHTHDVRQILRFLLCMFNLFLTISCIFELLNRGKVGGGKILLIVISFSILIYIS